MTASASEAVSADPAAPLMSVGEPFKNLFFAEEPQTMGVQIVVLDRGFVYVGDVTVDADWVTIRNARNIRRWGTTRGLGRARGARPAPRDQARPGRHRPRPASRPDRFDRLRAQRMGSLTTTLALDGSGSGSGSGYGDGYGSGSGYGDGYGYGYGYGSGSGSGDGNS